jgi:hypothetical protein
VANILILSATHWHCTKLVNLTERKSWLIYNSISNVYPKILHQDWTIGIQPHISIRHTKINKRSVSSIHLPPIATAIISDQSPCITWASKFPHYQLIFLQFKPNDGLFQGWEGIVYL